MKKVNLILIALVAVVGLQFVGCDSMTENLIDNHKSVDFDETLQSHKIDLDILAQLKSKTPTIQQRELARIIDNEIEFDYENTTIMYYTSEQLHSLITFQKVVGDLETKYVYYNFLENNVVLDNGIIVEYSDADNTFYYFTDAGILIGSIAVIDNENVEIQTFIDEGNGMDELFGFWGIFTDCWNVSMADGWGAAAGVSGAAGAAGIPGGGAGAAVIVGGVSMGCLAAAIELSL